MAHFGTEKSTLSNRWFNYDPNPFEVLVPTFPQYDDVTENFVMSKMSFGKFQTGATTKHLHQENLFKRKKSQI